ncbi:MAG: hypothetical protein RSG52_05100 [Terrisporobacter sp.]|uniref:hypothetical protein n=1 Tax=Clostridia TaxID=186801 RepID=UPI002FC9BFA8
MKKKISFLLVILIGGILILTSIYIFVGYENKKNNTQTMDIENAVINKQDTDKKHTIKDEVKSSEDVNESTIQINRSEVSNKKGDEKKIITVEGKIGNIKSESQVSNKEKETKSVTNKFTMKEATNLCEKKYGKNSDAIYACDENVQDVNGERGYLVQVKSKELMKQGGNGVAFTVLVTLKGQIIEL